MAKVRVICGRPNASDRISGVHFFPLEDGRKISEEIDEAVAEQFLGISGYELDDEPVEEPKAPEPPPAAPRLTKAQQKAKDAAEKASAPQPQPPVAEPISKSEDDSVF